MNCINAMILGERRRRLTVESEGSRAGFTRVDFQLRGSQPQLKGRSWRPDHNKTSRINASL
jgi:hypothetical protein